MELLEPKYEGPLAPKIMIRHIIGALNAWQDRQPFNPTTQEPLLWTAITTQTAVEWQLFIEGCLAKE